MCLHGHYERAGRQLLGHLLPCSSEGCFSVLRAVRSAAVHYPEARSLLLRQLYEAIRINKTLTEIDEGLSEGDHELLLDILGIEDYAIFFENECIQSNSLANLEQQLMVKHAGVINEWLKKVSDDPVNACCSCEKLFKRANVTFVEVGGPKWVSELWQALLLTFKSEKNAAMITLFAGIVVRCLTTARCLLIVF